MPTSNSKPQVSPATDSPLGAPGGNEPYKTVRMRNVANPETNGSATDTNIGADAGKEAEDMSQKTAPIGNIAQGKNTSPQPKPSQGA